MDETQEILLLRGQVSALIQNTRGESLAAEDCSCVNSGEACNVQKVGTYVLIVLFNLFNLQHLECVFLE